MRVLLVENNLSNRIIAQSILHRDHHVVTIAVNGADAVTKVQSERFDVILLDIVMPVMDGFQTVRYVNSLPSRPRYVFALSAYDTPEDLQLYRAAGFDGLIAKPLRSGDLFTAVQGQQERRTTTTVGYAANADQADSRPLLDEAVIRDGPGKADDITRHRILKSYREDLSDSLKEISYALPGCVEHDGMSLGRLHHALHGLRSASLTVGLNRAPYLALRLRYTPHEQILEDVATLLRVVRESLPRLEAVLEDIAGASVSAGQRRPGV